jgi:site-specific DNA-methyltransferase (adenine-specific)
MSHHFTPTTTNYELIEGDCLKLLPAMEECSVDVVWTDPPYFLSNGGQTCKNGKRAKVSKGQWDESKGINADHEFHRAWLSGCQRVLKPNGTIWISSTHHTLFSIGYAMQELGFKILNLITWEKPNPPPQLACRYFTHSTEQIIWAAKNEKSRHVFNYSAMKIENGGKQMKTVWTFKAPSKAEKSHGSHPTQKPLALVSRCLRASTSVGDVVLDPFAGSGTTGVAAVSLGRRFIGIEKDATYRQLSCDRIQAVVDASRGADTT